MFTGVDKPEQKTNNLTRAELSVEIPIVIEAVGLSLDRFMFTYKTVRPNLSTAKVDATWPKLGH